MKVWKGSQQVSTWLDNGLGSLTVRSSKMDDTGSDTGSAPLQFLFLSTVILTILSVSSEKEGRGSRKFISRDADETGARIVVCHVIEKHSSSFKRSNSPRCLSSPRWNAPGILRYHGSSFPRLTFIGSLYKRLTQNILRENVLCGPQADPRATPCSSIYF